MGRVEDLLHPEPLDSRGLSITHRDIVFNERVFFRDAECSQKSSPGRIRRQNKDLDVDNKASSI